MSTARHHAEWLSLIEVSGPFLSMPVLLRVFPQGLGAHDPALFQTLKLGYEEWQDNNEAGARTNPALHPAWIKFVLTSILGLPTESLLEFQAIPQSLAVTPPGEHSETIRPNLVLIDPSAGKPRLLIQTYPPNQDLDKPVPGKTWKASPGTRMMELLHASGVRLGLVTNGERWMLVDAPKSETTGFASWYANLWIEEKITVQAFVSLLGTERFFGVVEEDTLEKLLQESAGNQQEVTDQLGYQVRNAVEVLVQAIDRINQDRNGQLLEGVPEKLLYEAALTYMMRLVFLFCAEERRLFPLDNELYAQHYAASTLRDQLRRTADYHGEEILGLRHDAWSRLLSTFRMVFGGCEHPELRMPAYAGHLFDPDRFTFLEGRKASTSWRNCEANPLPVNNRTVLHLLEALQLLQVKVPGGGERQARRLSFRALDIEQIGHVYEGLLDHTAKRATEPMLGMAGGRDSECELPLTLLESLLAQGETKLVEFLNQRTGRSVAAIKKALSLTMDPHDAGRFRSACGNDDKLVKRIEPFAGLIRRDSYDYPAIIRTGSIFVTAGTDRRSSGTHYTPRVITEPLVRYTLEPIVYSGPAVGKPENEWTLRTAGELLDLKVCDMACGSGAILVQVGRYMSERLMEAWEIAEKSLPKGMPGITPTGTASSGKPGETLIPKDSDERTTYARRLIAQRCLYGVDINPLAAEMAKLSLWLLTLAKDRPFTFLDHAIRCGDSLVGVSDLKQLKTFSLDGTGQQFVFGEEPLEELVQEATSLRVAIEMKPADNALEVETKTHDLEEYEVLVSFLKCAADFLIAAEFKPGTPRDKLGYRDDAAIQLGHLRQFDNREQYSQSAGQALAGRRPFHWPLEFPEVLVERGGFDAFVGNPPFLGGTRISTVYGTPYIDYLKAIYNGAGNRTDLVAYFFRRAYALLNPSGSFALIGTNTISETDTSAASLGFILNAGGSIFRAWASRLWPGTAGVFISQVHVSIGTWDGAVFLDDYEVDFIDAVLSPSQPTAQPFTLTHPWPCGNGMKPNGDGFLITAQEASSLLTECPKLRTVVLPYIAGEDVARLPDALSGRYAIYFGDVPLSEAQQYPAALEIVRQRVLPERSSATNRVKRELWWQFERHAKDVFAAARSLSSCWVVPETSKYVAFARVPSSYAISNGCIIVASDEWWLFGVLQSSLHEAWARRPGMSKLKTDPRYNAGACFRTFAFPPKTSQLEDVAERYFSIRERIIRESKQGLTFLYNRFHDPSDTNADIQSLRDLQDVMDHSVARSYGWDKLVLGHGFHETKQGIRFTISELARREVLSRLLEENHLRYKTEVDAGLHDSKKGRSKSMKPKWELKSDPSPQPKLFE